MSNNFFKSALDRLNKIADRLPTRRLVIAVVVFTLCGAIPLLSIWQVALAAGDEVRCPPCTGSPTPTWS